MAEDMQKKCLELTTQSTECRFDPDFEAGSDPVRFPRESREASASNIKFDENSGQLTVQTVQVAGELPNYNVSLQLNPSAAMRFDVTAVSNAGSAGDWAHRARYFPDGSLLYLPSLQVLPPGPGSNLFDVYLQYSTDGQQEWLQLLEYEQVP